MLIVRFAHTETAAEVMCLRYLTVRRVYALLYGEAVADIVEEGAHADNGALLRFEGPVHFGVITAVDKDADRNITYSSFAS